MRTVRQLYELQELDWGIQQFEEELSEVRTRIADDAKRGSRRTEGCRLSNESSMSWVRPDASLSARSNRSQSVSQCIDSRMYSGSVTNPRELEAYQEERATLFRNQRSEEDRLLEFMVEMEETQELRDQARAVFEQVDGDRRRELDTLGARQEELTSDLPELRSQRQELSTEYPPNVMAVYETVRRSRGGQGAALVDQRGMCQGCRLTIPNAERSRARSGDYIVQCGSCSRILIHG